MPVFRIPIQASHPPCPECQMGMIAVDGFNLEPDWQTFECVRCGRIEKPAKPNERAQGAVTSLQLAASSQPLAKHEPVLQRQNPATFKSTP
jgi:hypothetical protein